MSKYVSTMHSFNSEEIFMSYSFVSPRKNTWNFTKYIFDDVLTLLNSFPLSNLTEISWMQQIHFRWPWAFWCLWYTIVNNAVLILRRYLCSTALFVLYRNNLWNFTKYILDNVQTTSDSFPLSNLTRIVGCNKTFLDGFGALDGIGTQM